jgi:hypothetical protein
MPVECIEVSFLFHDRVYSTEAALTLFSGSEAAGYPLKNLAAYQPSIPFRAVQVPLVTTIQIDATFGSAEAYDVIALVGAENNLGGWDFAIDGAPQVPGNVTASQVDTRGTVAGASEKWLTYYRLVTPTAGLVWRATIDFTDEITIDPSIGRMMIGSSYKPTGDLVDYSWEWIDQSRKLVTPGSVVWTAQAVGHRRVSYVYEYLSEDDAFEDFPAMYRKAGGWLPVLAITDQRPELSIHGFIDGEPVVRQVGPYHQTTVNIIETAAG